MGGYSSRILTYREAESRLKAEELLRFDNAFKRIASGTKGVDAKHWTVQKNAFRALMLSEFPSMPTALASRLFEAFDTEKAGSLTWATFLSGLTVLISGTPEEQLRFAFNAYDVERNGQLEYRSIRQLVALCQIPGAGSKTADELVDDLFNKTDEINFDRFALHFSANRTSPLIDWISQVAKRLTLEPSEEVRELERKLDPGSTRRNMSAATHFTEVEILVLQKFYKILRSESSSGLFDKAVLEKVFQSKLSPALISSLYYALDDENKGMIEMREFVQCLSIVSRGSLADKVDFCFKMFDVSRDDKLSRDELRNMCFAVWNVDEAAGGPLEADGPSASWGRRIVLARSGSSSGGEPDTPSKSFSKRIDQLVKLAFESEDTATDKVAGEFMTKEQFTKWVSKTPDAINFLDKIRSVTTIDMGLKPVSPGEEGEIIKGLYKSFNPEELTEGKVWFVISQEWWNTWTDFVNFDSGDSIKSPDLSPKRSNRPQLVRQLSGGSPGPIDNSLLLQEKSMTKLRLDLSLHHDYKIIPEKVWTALLSWYSGGPPLPRRVIVSLGRPELELYPLGLRFSWLRDGPGEIVRKSEYTWSKVATVAQVKADISKILRIPTEEMRIWNCFSEEEEDSELLKDDDATLEEVNMIDGQMIIVELLKSDGTWPRTRRGSRSESTHAEKAIVPGLVGLQNLGNTCFMNSSLQALSNTPMLTEYFTSGAYTYDINVNGTMGMQGRLAAAYGELQCDLWQSRHASLAPRRFKAAIGKFRPEFLGYEQHDSQEFLSLLIDGLNEDLNRVVKKPYVEQPDSNGRADSVVADEWWWNQLRREVSIIQAVFTGQFKSLVRCSTCSFESARFEPFRLLQLPLPEEERRSIVVHVMPISSQPIRLSVRVLKEGTIEDVVDEILKLNLKPLAGIGKDELILADVVPQHYIHGAVDVKKSVNLIRDGDLLFAYQIPPVREIPAAQKRDKLLSSEGYKIEVGMQVHSKWRGKGQWYLGRVKAINEDDTFHIVYDDDDEDNNLDDTCVKPIVRVAYTVDMPIIARFKGGRRYFEGRVVESEEDGEHFKVIYHDGDIEEHVNRNLMEPRDPLPLYPPILHRRISKMVNYYLNPLRTDLFGLPLLLQFIPEYTTGRQVYEQVFNRIAWFYHRVMPKREPGETVPRLYRRGDSEYASKLKALKAETVEAWGFSLSLVSKQGGSCSRCNWMQSCSGCFLAPDDVPVVQIRGDDSIAVDWDPIALEEDYHFEEAGNTTFHESIEANRALDVQPLSLAKCFESFTSVEKLSGTSTVYCSKCKEHRDSTKTLEIWRPPPVLVLQLKRFRYTSFSRRKLSNLVNFPLKDLDLSPFIAKGIERPAVEITWWRYLGGKLKTDTKVDDATKPSDVKKVEESKERRKSSSWPLPTPRERPPALYDLYAVVNHYGGLGAGHYTAFAMNAHDEKWYKFDDSSVRQVPEKEVVSPASYLLFYVRKDIKGKPFESLFPRDLDSIPVDVNLLMKKSLRDRCVVM